MCRSVLLTANVRLSLRWPSDSDEIEIIGFGEPAPAVFPATFKGWPATAVPAGAPGPDAPPAAPGIAPGASAAAAAAAGVPGAGGGVAAAPGAAATAGVAAAPVAAAPA